jgi:hypothetical protein
VCRVFVMNKGSFALLIFERQVTNMFQADLLDLDVNEFRFSSQRFPLIGIWYHWICRSKLVMSCVSTPLSSATEALEHL